MRDGRAEMAFLTSGGAGTLLIEANFIYCLHEYLKDEPVDFIVYGHKSMELNEAVFGRQVYIREYFPYKERIFCYCSDVCVELVFYPNVLKLRSDIEVLCPKLWTLLHKWQRFAREDLTRKKCLAAPHKDYGVYALSIIKGKNCLDVYDAGDDLNIGKDFTMPMECEKDEYSVLQRCGLERRNYITLQRGGTPASRIKESPKNWPLRYYNELIGYLKRSFPDKKLVQLGESEAMCDRMDDIDVNLLGKTDWEDLKALLKNAWLHVDGECGMVHLRRAMHGGPSVVLFGMTPMEFYGYEGNINLRSNACPHWCARTHDLWIQRCALGSKEPACMAGLYPYEVMDKIYEWYVLEHIRQGMEMPEPMNGKLLRDPRITIDETYIKTHINYQYIYGYEIKKLRISELKAFHYGPEGCCWMKMKDSPAYRQLKDGGNIYRTSVERLQKEYYDDRHTVEKFEELVDSLEQKGFDEKQMVMVKADQCIQDGKHRCAWLMAKHGLDAKADVLVLHALSGENILFPFDRIPRGAKVVVYGMGAVGLSFVRQLKATGYAKIAGLIDRNAKTLFGGCIWGAGDVWEPCVLTERIIDWDYVVIASVNVKNATDIYRLLQDSGIEESRIVHCCHIMKALYQKAVHEKEALCQNGAVLHRERKE